MANFELKADPMRVGLVDKVHIPVRAKNGDRWVAFDLAELDGPSVLFWLRSRGEKSSWAEQVVLYLLGHDSDYKDYEDAIRGYDNSPLFSSSNT